MRRAAEAVGRALALLSLAACVESDPPALTLADLAEVPRLSDRFSLVPTEPVAADAPAQTVYGFRGADGTYAFLQISGTMEVPEQVWSAGNQVRLLELSGDRYLVISIYWDPLFSGHVYTLLDLSDPTEFRLLSLDLGKAAIDADFVASIRGRLDVALTYADGMEDDSGIPRTHIEGTPDAAKLRALFTDAEFRSRLSTKVIRRLRPLR